MRKAFVLCLSLALLLTWIIPARAQVSARAVLYDLHTDAFPSQTAGLDVYDSAGGLVTDLPLAAVTLLEDGQPRPAEKLEDLTPGVQFALALNPGAYFAYRDTSGVSRYDKIYTILQNWAATHADDFGDDLSFVPTEAVPSVHLASTAAFSDALETYSPPLALIKPTLDTLGHAIDAVSEDAPAAGMKRSVLFVTSPPTPDQIPVLQNLTQKAAGQNVQVNVWIIVPAEAFQTAGATALKDLAIQTGGQYILYSGQEPLPGLEVYLAPLRHAYRVTYTSSILTSGEHTVAANLNMNGEIITSASLPFEVNIEPPNPMLVSPPRQIVREAPDERTLKPADFLPKGQTIEILVEFPDGRTRPLTRTTLFVDGEKAAENLSDPFDRFIWDVSGYSESGQHVLSVEAVDSFGLSRRSLGVPVTVTVVKPPTGLLPYLSRNRLWVLAGALVGAGAVLGVVLVSGRTRRKRRSAQADRKASRDPLTQPVIRVREDRRKGRFPWSRAGKPSDAYLVRVKDDGQPLTAPSIPVVIPEMTFGSDPLQVNRILDDPSVSPVHARIRQENGQYMLYDEKSTAGTWLNYDPLTAPARLRHGDIIQIGRYSYRFMLRKIPEPAAPKVTPIDKR
jgi:hypothetical protein